jgi:hypothetical protein
MKIIPGSRRCHHIAIVSVFLIMAALITGMVGCDDTTQNLEIRTWYDLDAIRDNLSGNYTLMNDIDSTTAGYDELASPTANGGKGWEPIGILGGDASFTGTFDGQGYEIRDLFINRPDQIRIGLFGMIDFGAVMKNLGVVNVTVIGDRLVGGLVGLNDGTISNSYSTGSMTGNDEVGGLVGRHSWGALHNCYSIASVTGEEDVGGLVGRNEATTVDDSYCRGTVSDSYSRGKVTGQSSVGGLVGATDHHIMVENSYSGGSVTGNNNVGGLVALDEFSTVSNSYSTASVTGSSNVGGLVGQNYDGTISNSYSTGNVTGNEDVGGLVGQNYDGTISNSYSTGNVTGDERVGGLVGYTYYGTMSNSYSTGSVTGNSSVGGLVGRNDYGTVSNSFWDTETSGQATSDGGTGKNTTDMQDIATFSGAAWDITAVANPSTRNSSYIWNIVDDETYPFLSWQP